LDANTLEERVSDLEQTLQVISEDPDAGEALLPSWKGVRKLSKALQDPNVATPELALRLGRLLYRFYDFAEGHATAARLFSRALDEMPKSAEANYWAGTKKSESESQERSNKSKKKRGERERRG
jgi:hypothetical protein